MSFGTGFGVATSTPAPAFSFGAATSTTATPVKPGKSSSLRLCHISNFVLLHVTLQGYSLFRFVLFTFLVRLKAVFGSVRPAKNSSSGIIVIEM